MELNITLLVAILVIVSIILLFQFEQYRKIMGIFTFYTYDPPPPKELNVVSSFLNKKYHKSSN